MQQTSISQPRVINRGWVILALSVFLFLSACDQSGASIPPTAPGVTAPVTSISSATSAVTLEVTSAVRTMTPGLPDSKQTTPTATQATAIPSQVAPTSAGGLVTSLPDPSSAQWVTVSSALDDPVGIANAGDGSGRLFVLERQGRIQVLSNGQPGATPYLDITDRVGSRGSEQGLLGLAFHPKFKENGFFYVNYTDENGNTVIARFHADPTSNQADPGSEKDLLRVDQPYPNHNGGSMLFGPDGFLYFGLGDGGSQGDPNNTAQSLNTYLGKILRIDVDHGDPYAIPADNPFQKQGKSEIWAYGLRNPWRIDIDPATHDMYIGDVGQDAWEEIDYLPAGTPGGTNFGWSYLEGTHPYKGNVPAGLALTGPVFEYSHDEGGCSVTGGVVYRGQALPGWQGVYLFGDYCSGIIWGLLHRSDGTWDSKVLYQTNYAITSFGRDEQGEIYLADQHGSIYRLQKP